MHTLFKYEVEFKCFIDLKFFYRFEHNDKLSRFSKDVIFVFALLTKYISLALYIYFILLFYFLSLNSEQGNLLLN